MHLTGQYSGFSVDLGYPEGKRLTLLISVFLCLSIESSR